MSEFVPFDFEESLKYHCKQAVEWLKANHKKPITEEQFVTTYKGLAHNHPRRGQHTPSALKKQYHRLKDRYGFFQ